MHRSTNFQEYKSTKLQKYESTKEQKPLSITIFVKFLIKTEIFSKFLTQIYHINLILKTNIPKNDKLSTK